MQLMVSDSSFCRLFVFRAMASVFWLSMFLDWVYSNCIGYQEMLVVVIIIIVPHVKSF